MYKKLFTITIKIGHYYDGTPKRKMLIVQAGNPSEAIAFVKATLNIGDAEFMSIDDALELLVSDE